MTRSGGFKYPDKWSDIDKVPLNRDGDDSLMGLARAIGKEMQGGTVPELVIAGSRGAQVVLPVLLRFFWRGPFVNINAGILTSNAAIPELSEPWLVTCGRDYFATSDESFVAKKFAELSAVPGHHIRLRSQQHRDMDEDDDIYPGLTPAFDG